MKNMAYVSSTKINSFKFKSHVDIQYRIDLQLTPHSQLELQNVTLIFTTQLLPEQLQLDCYLKCYNSFVT